MGRIGNVASYFFLRKSNFTKYEKLNLPGAAESLFWLKTLARRLYIINNRFQFLYLHSNSYTRLVPHKFKKNRNVLGVGLLNTSSHAFKTPHYTDRWHLFYVFYFQVLILSGGA